MLSRLLYPLFSLIILTSAVTSMANESLYDKKSILSSSVTSYNFGPKSSHYRYDKRMIHAAEIATQRAHAHSTSRCWHYVKNALVDAQVVNTRPETAYAKEAGAELSRNYGFTQLRVSNPLDAPVGSVLVYGGRGAGHVEIRTKYGFASDFNNPHPSNRPLLGVYVKPS